MFVVLSLGMIKIIYFISWWLLLLSCVCTTTLPEITVDSLWPQYSHYGQISAVTVDTDGTIYVFHRGRREWEYDSFNKNEVFTKTSEGPIPEPTVIVLNTNGSVLTRSGRDMFFMPHGLTIDNKYNVWVTDVALHQVIKFPPLSKVAKDETLGQALLTLGEALVPGRGSNHFCKPTSVVIDPASQDFFVADGYCNSRIAKFNKNGKFLLQWGQKSTLGHIGHFNLNVPHSLCLDEARGQLMVADRENSRIVCYTTEGNYIHELKTGNHVYGISYSPVTDMLYAVTGGPSLMKPGFGIAYSMKQGNLTALFYPPKNFQSAHDVAVSPDGRFIYAVELNPHVLWKFPVEPATSENTRPDELRPLKQSSKKLEKIEPSKIGPVLVDNDPAVSSNANQIAVSIVAAVVILSIIAVGCHIYRKKDTDNPVERRGLIIYDEDDIIR